MSRHQHHLLIVEDDYAFRWALGVRCYKRLIEIDVAENGAEAAQMLENRKGRYCSVILDLKMPIVDGTAVIDKLTAQTDTPPVVVVTGHPDMAEAIQQQSRNVVRDVLLKPVDVDVVISRAAAHCDHVA